MHVDREIIATIADAAGLSPRQREVLQQQAEGRPAEEIAADLGIGLKTVYTHSRRARNHLQQTRERIVLLEGIENSLEWYEFLLREAIPGPPRSDPPTPQYSRVFTDSTGRTSGEDAKLRATPVTADDIVGHWDWREKEWSAKRTRKQRQREQKNLEKLRKG